MFATHKVLTYKVRLKTLHHFSGSRITNYGIHIDLNICMDKEICTIHHIMNTSVYSNILSVYLLDIILICSFWPAVFFLGCPEGRNLNFFSFSTFFVTFIPPYNINPFHQFPLNLIKNVNIKLEFFFKFSNLPNV